MAEHQHAHHHHPAQLAAAGLSGLRFGLLLTGVILAVEIAGGLWAGSVALLSDAGHVLLDGFALGLSWFALKQAERPPNPNRTFGYHRTGILAAALNSLILVLLSLLLIYRAILRLQHPAPVAGPIMLIAALLGLGLNLLVAQRLGGHHNLNLRTAMWHSLGDAGAALGVIVASLVIALWHWYQADPIMGLVIAIVIAVGAFRLLAEAINVLMEGTPSHVDVEHLTAAITALPGVLNIHDLHVWTITTDWNALSCHLLVEKETLAESQALLDSLEELLQADFGIQHSTVQLEDHHHHGSTLFCLDCPPEAAAANSHSTPTGG